MASTPSPKRKRVEKDEETQSPASKTQRTYERPADFWIEDGNVVLQVEQTQFRVHRSALRSHSDFFDDMFNLPQPPNTPMVEGCVLVDCTGDSVQDWTNLLTLLYLPLRNQHCFAMPYLLSMLRLGKKYQFALIRDEALKKLKWKIPTTLEDWVKDMSPLDPLNLPWKYFLIRDREFDLIDIAEELGIQSILPGLYYICAVTMKTDRLLEGNGTIAHLSPVSQRLVNGQSKILSFMTSQTMAWIFEKKTPHRACVSPNKCSIQRVDLMRTLVPKLVVDLRFVLDEVTDFTTLRFCSPCMAHVKKMHQDARSKFWKELPSMFGLPEWEDLTD